MSAEPKPGFPDALLKKAGGAEKEGAVMPEATRLMLAVKDGDAQAFDQLVTRMRGRAFHLAQALVGSREDALDLAQEAFLKVYRARETFREGDPFLPWFHRILRNTCYSFLRQRGRLRAISVSGAGAEEGDYELCDDAPGPGARLEADEREGAFRSAFQTLSARDREIIALRHFRELSYREIAESLGIPQGTVMSRLFHARRRLRDKLAGVLGELPAADEGGALAPSGDV